MRVVDRFALLIGALLLVACTYEEEEGAQRDRSIVPEAKEELPAALDGELLTAYVDALSELRAQGFTDDADIGDDLTRPAEMAKRMLFGPQALSIMRRHGFEHAKLRQVRAWVLMAYGALQFEAKRDELEAERDRDLRASERLKERMAAEDYNEMRAKIEDSVASLDRLYGRVSANDRELVRARIEVLEALLK
jgi:hypothetical protein